jgi:hypothetical protein
MPRLRGIRIRCNLCRGAFSVTDSAVMDDGFDFARSDKDLLANGWSIVTLPWRPGKVHICPCCSVMVALGIYLPSMIAASNQG